MEPYKESFGLLLKLAASVVARRLKKVLAQKDLNLSEFTILRVLGDQDGTSLQEISRVSRMSPAQLTNALKLLKKKSLVCTEVSNSDRRINHIFLTKAGKRTLKEAGQSRDRFVGKLGLTSEEIETIRRLTRKIISIEE